MRDAFGGVFMMRLFLVFIVVYVGFGAISFNYAKSFKLKNKVIDFIELSQVQPSGIEAFYNNPTTQPKLDNMIDDISYNYSCNKKNGVLKNKSGNVYGFCYRGVVVEKAPEDNSSKEINTQTYIIKVYNSWNLGLFDSFLALIGRNRNEGYAVNGCRRS